MTESERSLAAIFERTRLALALGIIGFVGIAQLTSLVPGEIVVRALTVGIALAGAAAIQEVLDRRGTRQLGITVGVVTEFLVFALAVALFHRQVPLVPFVLVWPILTGAVLLPQRYVLYLAALASVIVLEVTLGTGGAPDPLVPIGWAVLYLGSGALGGVVGTAFRRAQRSTEASYSSIATLSAASSYGELSRILFSYLERTLDLPRDAPLALLFDERASGTYAAIEAQGLDPEARARFRVGGPTVDLLRTLSGAQGVWIDPKRAFSAEQLPLPEAFRSGVLFVAPLRDARRLVGFAFASRDRIRRFSPEAQTALLRLTDQVASTTVRIRGARVVELERQAMAGFLDARGAGGSDSEIASWLGRNARAVAHADGAAVLQEDPDSLPTVLLSTGLGSGDIAAESGGLLAEVRNRGVALVISDGENEERIVVPPFLRRGSCVVLPIPGHPAYLLVQRHERDGFSAGDLQLLVMLADQAGLLFTRIRGPIGLRPAASDHGEGQEADLATVAAIVPVVERGDPSAAQGDERARIVDALRLAVEGNQPQLAGSGQRVATLAGAIAGALGCDAETRDAVYVGSLLRDVGELGLDRRILDTPGQLTPEQRNVVERHPLLGETILATLSFLSPAARIVKSHHERWDGSGYPSGLREHEIPIGARIVAVADAFVAMTSERPYRSALRASDALAALLAGRDRTFDPAVVDALIGLSETGTVPLAPMQ